MVNWKIRLKNKSFWLSMIPALILLAKEIFSVFGVNLELGYLSEQLLSIVDSLFVILALIGIVNDPTTESFRDSKQAMSYDAPKEFIDDDQESLFN